MFSYKTEKSGDNKLLCIVIETDQEQKKPKINRKSGKKWKRNKTYEGFITHLSDVINHIL